MRCGVVMSSVLTKYGRWDPAIFFGTVKREEDAVVRAEERLKEAKASVARAKRAVKAEKKRVADMLASGDVRPIESGT